MSSKLGFLILAAGVALVATEPAMAADLFAGAKATIKENAGSSSGLYQAMTVTGLGAAGLGGYLTKNWGRRHRRFCNRNDFYQRCHDDARSLSYGRSRPFF